MGSGEDGEIDGVDHSTGDPPFPPNLESDLATKSTQGDKGFYPRLEDLVLDENNLEDSRGKGLGEGLKGLSASDPLQQRGQFDLAMKALEKQWKPLGSFEVFSRENGFFLFRFGDKSDCKRAIENGPWYFEGRLLVTKKWEVDVSCERDMINKIPLWSQKSISRITSTFGKPLYVDSATEKRERLAFARCCVEVSFDDELKDTIPLYEEGMNTLHYVFIRQEQWSP